MLFDGTGQAIYLFNKEQTTKPQCYGACAKAWPPVLTKGAPIAADGTRPSLLGTAKRTDGGTDPADIRRPSVVLLCPRGQERGEVPQHPRVRRPLASRHPSRASSRTLTSSQPLVLRFAAVRVGPRFGAGRDKNVRYRVRAMCITRGVRMLGGSSRSTSARRPLPGTQVG